MKDFLKMTLAVIVGTILLSIAGSILFFGLVSIIASIGSATAGVPKKCAVVLDLSETAIAEQTVEASPLAGLSAQLPLTTIGIWDAVSAINAAAEDPAVKFLYLKTDGNTTGIATLYEVRKALERFRESGKAIVAYTEAPSTGDYYLASVADKVYMTPHPGATTLLTGVSSQMFFLKDLLEKLGVNVQLIRHGKYKSAGEMFVRNEPSKENREQYQVMVNSIWSSIAEGISESRGISVEQINEAIDGLRLCTPQDFLDNGFVDELLTRDRLQEKLAALAMEDRYKDIKWISLPDYAAARLLPSKVHEKIAVIYADGQIVDGKGLQEVAGKRFASIIQSVRADSTVKAVVLRVNSPGGAVLAAEQIKNELDLLKKDKPLIASYGEYAASGGYWISAAADRIFSDPGTLTGSIGVFSMIPDFSKTAEDIAHVNVVSISSGKHGDMYSLMRPFDSAEYEYMQTQIEGIYTRFASLVADGRGMEIDAVDAIGQGRVWTGSDALGINLVDEIGTLEDAVRYAATVAGNPELTAWNVKGYPTPETQIETILNTLSGRNGGNEDVLTKLSSDFSKPQIFARLPYDIKVR